MRSFKSVLTAAFALAIVAGSAVATAEIPSQIFARPTPPDSTALPLRVDVLIPGGWTVSELVRISPYYVTVDVDNDFLNMHGRLRIKNDFPANGEYGVSELCSGLKGFIHSYWVFTEFEDWSRNGMTCGMVAAHGSNTTPINERVSFAALYLNDSSAVVSAEMNVPFDTDALEIRRTLETLLNNIVIKNSPPE